MEPSQASCRTRHRLILNKEAELSGARSLQVLDRASYILIPRKAMAERPDGDRYTGSSTLLEKGLLLVEKRWRLRLGDEVQVGVLAAAGTCYGALASSSWHVILGTGGLGRGTARPRRTAALSDRS